MLDQDSKGISYTGGFFMLIAFAVAGLLLGSLLAIPVWQAMTGTGIETMKEGMSNPANSNVMKVIQAITAVVGFFVPTLITAAILNRRPIKLLGLSSTDIRLNQVGLVILIVAGALVISASLSYFNSHLPIPETWRLKFDTMERQYNEQVEAIISLRSTGDFVLALVIMGFLPAFCEETFFRGGLQNFMTRGSGKPWLSIIVVSFLFSLAHISYYGFLSRFFLGIILGAIFHYSGKLWLSILAHFLNNALAITMIYISIRQGTPLKEAMKDSDSTAGPWGILVIPVVVVLFVLFKKTFTGRRRLA